MRSNKNLLKIIIILLVISFIFLQIGLASVKPEIIYFYSPGCSSCLKVEKYLYQVKKEYPKVSIKFYSIYEKENQRIRMIYDKTYNVPQNKKFIVPAIFVGRHYFIGEKDIEKILNEKILYKALGEEFLKLDTAPKKPEEILSNFDFLVVLSAGLLD
jgi:thiol-disulfide isomerase/thioredoxin